MSHVCTWTIFTLYKYSRLKTAVFCIHCLISKKRAPHWATEAYFDWIGGKKLFHTLAPKAGRIFCIVGKLEAKVCILAHIKCTSRNKKDLHMRSFQFWVYGVTYYIIKDCWQWEECGWVCTSPSVCVCVWRCVRMRSETAVFSEETRERDKGLHHTSRVSKDMTIRSVRNLWGE